MNILGLNGWDNRFHDAAACLVKDNRLVFALEEERVVRKKHSFDLVPIQSTLYALKHSKLTIDDIDVIAFGWDIRKLFKQNLSDQDILNVLLPRKVFKYSKRPKLVLIPHHLAHAYYSYYSSPFVGQKAAILIVDGQGEKDSLSMGYADKNGLSLDYSMPASQSLGYFYEAICRFLGYSNLDGGKIMGLAGYGKHKSIKLDNQINYFSKKLSGFPDIPVEDIDVEEKTIAWWVKKFEKNFDLPARKRNYIFAPSFKFERERSNHIEKKYIDVAHTGQKLLEKLFLQITKNLKDTYKVDKLVLGGGVALNCSVNQKIQLTHNIQVYIPSSPADSGVAIGAALFAVRQHYKTPILGAQTPYLGSDYTNKQVKQLLDKHKIYYKYVKKPESVVADLLSKNYLVGWFQGKSEFGPRALGNRSILANPLKANKDRLNELKSREKWRPLGVSILAEETKKYFEDDSISPYMMMTARASKKLIKMCPDIIHIDGTSRPQMITKKSNLLFYNLIKGFANLTGLPIVINTSFNRYDEPIVNSPEDALRTFFTTPLDALVINNYVIYKR